jgi:hypothetical protein
MRVTVAVRVWVQVECSNPLDYWWGVYAPCGSVSVEGDAAAASQWRCIDWSATAAAEEDERRRKEEERRLQGPVQQ